MADPYPRDMVGYGRRPPDPKWPDGARLAVQFVVNYEEGGENNVLHGDEASEAFLSEIVGATPLRGVRHLNMESIYEYGSRAGFWRVHRLFTSRDMPVTVYGVAMALERNPEAAAAMMDAGWEVATHGYRWIDYQYVDEDTEREHMRRAIEIQTRVTGQRPLGWYCGRCGPNTRKLVAEEGGFLYDADSYADDLPYWIMEYDAPLLIVPLYARQQRHAFRDEPGFQLRGPVLRISARCLRHALRGGRKRAQDDVRGSALPARRAAGTSRRVGALPRLRALTRQGLGVPPGRYSAPLAHVPQARSGNLSSHPAATRAVEIGRWNRAAPRTVKNHMFLSLLRPADSTLSERWSIGS